MANKQSALKELRKTKKRTAHNALIKTHVKHLFRECMDLINAGDMTKAKEKVALFQQAADKAAKRHIISVNRARRKKAALTAFINNKRQVSTKTPHGASKKSAPAAEVKPETTPEVTPAQE